MAFPSGDTFVQESTSPHLAVVEGEHATREQGGSTHNFVRETDDANAVNGSHIAVTPNSGTVFSAGDPSAPYIEVDIEFSATGTHYLWLRAIDAGGGSVDDSFHIRVDSGTWTTQNGLSNGSKDFNNSSSLLWIKDSSVASPMTVSISSTGAHTLRFQMREDGLHIDRILLTTDSTYDPAGVNGGDGPAESSTTGGGGAVSESLALTATGAPSISEQGSADETIQLVAGATPSVSETASATESVQLQATGSPSITETASATETLSVAATATLSITETVGNVVLEALSVTASGSPSVKETASASESVQVTAQGLPSVDETATATENIQATATAAIDITEEASATEALSVAAKATLRIAEITGAVAVRRVSEIGRNAAKLLTGSGNDAEQL